MKSPDVNVLPFGSFPFARKWYVFPFVSFVRSWVWVVVLEALAVVWLPYFVVSPYFTWVVNGLLVVHAMRAEEVVISVACTAEKEITVELTLKKADAMGLIANPVFTDTAFSVVLSFIVIGAPYFVEVAEGSFPFMV